MCESYFIEGWGGSVREADGGLRGDGGAVL